ncbi:cytochrome P450 6j1 [Anabrus simplex]|uniref:cytochrome P450 6j1 n=1 Tax=Anabrus simplex TaxID=316456 RepID=UPI0035A2B63E
MGLYFNSVLTELVIAVLTLLAVAYVYFTRNFRTWEKKGIPFLKPIPFFGNYKDLILVRKTTGVLLKDIYDKAADKPYIGVYAFDQPALVVRDTELIKKVLVKDFSAFVDRNFTPDKKLDPLAHRGLFSVSGQKWRQLRMKLTPTFTSGKMKRMFSLVDECGKQLVTYVEKHTEDGVLEVKDAMARFTTDVISTCAFGIEGDALTSDNSVFRAMLKRIFDLTYVRGLALMTAFFAPALASALKLQFVDDLTMNWIRKTVWSTVEYREKNNVVRKDFLDMLMQIRSKGQVEDDDNKEVSQKSSENFVFEGDDFVGQCFVFLTAGFETSSTTITFALYELSFHSEIQTRAREEIQSVLQKYDGHLTYEGLQEMTYVGKVVSETLRKYPVLPFLDRKAVMPYTLPESNIQLEKGSVVLIPVMGIHYDSKFYPDPERFDPERFSEERKRARPNYTYLPFGEGPRNCIGDRMGLMQSKVGLVHILANYEVKSCQGTPFPIVFDPRNSLLGTKDGIPLRFTRIKQVPAA